MDRTPSQTNVMEVGDQSALDFFDAELSRLSRLPARETCIRRALPLQDLKLWEGERAVSLLRGRE